MNNANRLLTVAPAFYRWALVTSCLALLFGAAFLGYLLFHWPLRPNGWGILLLAISCNITFDAARQLLMLTSGRLIRTAKFHIQPEAGVIDITEPAEPYTLLIFTRTPLPRYTGLVRIWTDSGFRSELSLKKVVLGNFVLT